MITLNKITLATLLCIFYEQAAACGRSGRLKVTKRSGFLLLSIIPKGGNGKTGGRPLRRGRASKKSLTKANSS